jgi:hypothetical protein
MSTDDTAASEHGADAETTAVPPPAADEPGLAWSVDDDTDEMPTKRHGRVVWAGLVTLVVAIVAVVIWLTATFFTAPPSKTSKPSAIPTTTALPAPPPPAASTFTDEQDQRLLSQLTGHTDGPWIVEVDHGAIQDAAAGPNVVPYTVR